MKIIVGKLSTRFRVQSECFDIPTVALDKTVIRFAAHRWLPLLALHQFQLTAGASSE